MFFVLLRRRQIRFLFLHAFLCRVKSSKELLNNLGKREEVGVVVGTKLIFNTRTVQMHSQKLVSVVLCFNQSFCCFFFFPQTILPSFKFTLPTHIFTRIPTQLMEKIVDSEYIFPVRKHDPKGSKEKERKALMQKNATTLTFLLTKGNWSSTKMFLFSCVCKNVF